jgi:circadian clock protein KaiB
MAKPKNPLGPAARRFEAAIAARAQEHVVLRLYVSGMSARSQQAIETIRRLCDENLPDRHELQIIDIYQQPELAKTEQLIAVPTLIKKLPPPLRKLVGDMQSPGQFLTLVGVREKPKDDDR